ncbi:toll-like receptor 2 isoform X2 [Branchiostoma lanceolatum]|uniref:toll-like receptor 2 isoform X2 n=1 Tax=Branchiostoma lanceolatum TaxID=7740 RepID=UPI003452404B
MATGGDPEHQWDVFISCHPNQLSYVLEVLTQALENIGQKVYLYERDSEPGAAIADNVFNAAMTSRKTVVCFTQDYLHSEWNLYEAMVAQGVKPSGGRMVPIHLLSCQIPQKYQLVCQLNCTDRLHRRFFWRKLLGALDIPNSSDIAAQLNVAYPEGCLDMLLGRHMPDVVPNPPPRSEYEAPRQRPQQAERAHVDHQEQLSHLFAAVFVAIIVCKMFDIFVKFVFGI